MRVVTIDGEHLTFAQVAEVAYGRPAIELAGAARRRMREARAVVERAARADAPVYGVNTGFGHLAGTRISPEEVARLQRNLLCSHAVGVGEPLPEPVVRAAMLLRANSLARGYSGARPEVVEALLGLLNAGVTPVVPSQGSLGASGDLAPLAHLALVLIGRGEATLGGRRLPGAAALAEAGLRPLDLQAKEGLCLINGTEVMGAFGALLAVQADRLVRAADVALALTLEALGGIADAFDARLHRVRPHPGQAAVAANVRRLVAGSQLLRRPGEGMPQDAYSLRAAPQVHGASRDALDYACAAFERELNASTDNPLVFSDTGDIISGANFHGQPLALAHDVAAIALAELSSVSERRIERLVNPMLSGLPPFLAVDGGLNSGMMVVQYVAAALVSENKLLASPASVDSIPTSANQEDHVSMGALAARKAWRVCEHTARVLAGELLCAAQAVEFRDPSRLGGGTAAAYRAVRVRVPPLREDREMDGDWTALFDLVRGGGLLDDVEEALGQALAGLAAPRAAARRAD